MNTDRRIWEQMVRAALAVERPRQLSPLVEAGGVAAAVVSESGAIYTGVCVDTASSPGGCAERAAIFSLITAGDNKVYRVAAIMSDGSVGPPCGACRELIAQMMPDRLDRVEILLAYPDIRTVALDQLLSMPWFA